jgi:hypothetical protein
MGPIRSRNFAQAPSSCFAGISFVCSQLTVTVMGIIIGSRILCFHQHQPLGHKNIEKYEHYKNELHVPVAQEFIGPAVISSKSQQDRAPHQGFNAELPASEC